MGLSDRLDYGVERLNLWRRGDLGFPRCNSVRAHDNFKTFEQTAFSS